MKKLVMFSVVAVACSAVGTARAQVTAEEFAKVVEEGCGPGCGTEHATGGGCSSCATGCAVAGACSTRGRR